jgi:hypothetical protein
MDDAQLERSLQGIGKKCLVNHYELFRDKSRTDASFVIDFLVKSGVSNEAGARIRVSFAKGIFNARREADALNIIAKSAGVTLETRDKARLLWNDSAAPPPPVPPAPIFVVAETETTVETQTIIIDAPDAADIAKAEAAQQTPRVPFTEDAPGATEPPSPATEERTRASGQGRGTPAAPPRELPGLS